MYNRRGFEDRLPSGRCPMFVGWLSKASFRSTPCVKQKWMSKGARMSVCVILQLVSVLREVRYLGAGQIGTIPKTAADIYVSRESFRQLVANLELMVTWYNKIIRTVLEVEYPLVQNHLDDIDVQLKEAEETLNWKTEGEMNSGMRGQEQWHGWQMQISIPRKTWNAASSSLWIKLCLLQKSVSKGIPLYAICIAYLLSSLSCAEKGLSKGKEASNPQQVAVVLHPSTT